MGEWITKKDANGNIYWYNTRTGQRSSGISLTTNTIPDGGTIKKNTETSTGISSGQNRQRDATVRQVNSYNTRAYKVHNHQDQTNHLTQKNQTAAIDKNGNYHAVQTNYTPTPEAPMEQVSPEFDLISGGSLLSDGAKKLGSKLVSKFGNKTATTEGAAELSPTLERAFENKVSQADFLKEFETQRGNLIAFYNSPNYKWRIANAGMSPEKGEILTKGLIDNTKNTKISLVGDIDKSATNAAAVSQGEVGGATYARTFEINNNGEWIIKTPEIFLNFPKLSGLKTRLYTMYHELLHASSRNSDGVGSYWYSRFKGKPIRAKLDSPTLKTIDEALEFDKALQAANMYPAITDKALFMQILAKNNPHMTTSRMEELWNLAQYITSRTEWRSRGLSLIDNAKKAGQSLSDYIKSNPMHDPAFSDMRNYASPQHIYNYASQALGISAPVGLGLKAYNTPDKVEYHKQGGQIKYFYD